MADGVTAAGASTSGGADGARGEGDGFIVAPTRTTSYRIATGNATTSLTHNTPDGHHVPPPGSDVSEDGAGTMAGGTEPVEPGTHQLPLAAVDVRVVHVEHGDDDKAGARESTADGLVKDFLPLPEDRLVPELSSAELHQLRKDSDAVRRRYEQVSEVLMNVSATNLPASEHDTAH
jgi:hypothetical protein